MTRRPDGRGRCKPHARELAARYLLVAGAFGPGGHRATAGAVAEGEPAAPFVTRSLPICDVVAFGPSFCSSLNRRLAFPSC